MQPARRSEIKSSHVICTLQLYFILLALYCICDNLRCNVFTCNLKLRIHVTIVYKLIFTDLVIRDKCLRTTKPLTMNKLLQECGMFRKHFCSSFTHFGRALYNLLYEHRGWVAFLCRGAQYRLLAAESQYRQPAQLPQGAGCRLLNFLLSGPN